MANTMIAAVSASSPALTNAGSIKLLGASESRVGSSSISITDGDALQVGNSGYISANSPLKIFGMFVQTQTGSLEVRYNIFFKSFKIIFINKIIRSIFLGYSELNL